MKILILGSVALPVPPPMQGGTERIAYWQAVGLSKTHEITLIAAKGSKADGYRLVEIGGDTIHAAPGIVESSRNLRKELVYMAQVSQYLLDHGKEFDLILNNMRGGESVLLPIAKLIGQALPAGRQAFVTVMHLPLFDELVNLFRQYNTPVITISNAQRRGFDGVNFVGTVYNCVEPELLEDRGTWGTKGAMGEEQYVLMMGSVAPHKNQKDGILAAKKLGKKIILAGKIGNQAYYDTEIKPFLGDAVIHKGEMGLEEKAELLAGADALLFPVLWPEPFGLVMIEAMACGTPVVAYGNGAVPEVVADGKTGWIVEPQGRGTWGTWGDKGDRGGIQKTGVDGLVEAVGRIGEIDRIACRKHVEGHFTVGKMVDSLERILQVML